MVDGNGGAAPRQEKNKRKSGLEEKKNGARVRERKSRKEGRNRQR